MQEYCSLFEDSRTIIRQKISGRGQDLDDWNRVVARFRNVVPGQQFHVLLSGRELSPEVLRRKAKRIANPKKVTPSKLLFFFFSSPELKTQLNFSILFTFCLSSFILSVNV